MNAKKTKAVGENVIQELYWAGDYVVYVDNRLVRTNFAETVARAERGEPFVWQLAKARDQHELQMTEDRHYRDWYRSKRKAEEIDQYGIDED